MNAGVDPRSAKKGSVTEEIEYSLATSPELFPAKTKGVLLASSSYKALERDRYQIEFVDEDTEGVLDGGHNLLSAGRFVLAEAGVSEREINKVRGWDDFRESWTENRSAVADIIEVLDFQMPVEVLIPADTKDDEVVESPRRKARLAQMARHGPSPRS